MKYVVQELFCAAEVGSSSSFDYAKRVKLRFGAEAERSSLITIVLFECIYRVVEAIPHRAMFGAAVRSPQKGP